MSKKTVSGWTAEQKEDFVTWHERRLEELNYPTKLVAELRDARDRWMPKTVEAA